MDPSLGLGSGLDFRFQNLSKVSSCINVRRCISSWFPSRKENGFILLLLTVGFTCPKHFWIQHLSPTSNCWLHNAGDDIRISVAESLYKWSSPTSVNFIGAILLHRIMNQMRRIHKILFLWWINTRAISWFSMGLYHFD